MPRKRARVRTDGIFYRQWNETWYSSITSRKLPLYDNQGQPIKGRHNEVGARGARYALRKPHSVEYPESYIHWMEPRY